MNAAKKKGRKKTPTVSKGERRTGGTCNSVQRLLFLKLLVTILVNSGEDALTRFRVSHQSFDWFHLLYVIFTSLVHDLTVVLSRPCLVTQTDFFPPLLTSYSTAGLKESPRMPLADSLLLTEIMDEIRKQVGVVFSQDSQ